MGSTTKQLNIRRCLILSNMLGKILSLDLEDAMIYEEILGEKRYGQDIMHVLQFILDLVRSKNCDVDIFCGTFCNHFSFNAIEETNRKLLKIDQLFNTNSIGVYNEILKQKEDMLHNK